MPVATKVAVDEYLEGFCEARLQYKAVFWGAQQVPAYPSDGVTLLLAGVGGVSRALVDGIRQLGSGSLFDIIHLADEASVVEARSNSGESLLLFSIVDDLIGVSLLLLSPFFERRSWRIESIRWGCVKWIAPLEVRLIFTARKSSRSPSMVSWSPVSCIFFFLLGFVVRLDPPGCFCWCRGHISCLPCIRHTH